MSGNSTMSTCSWMKTFSADGSWNMAGSLRWRVFLPAFSRTRAWRCESCQRPCCAPVVNILTRSTCHRHDRTRGPYHKGFRISQKWFVIAHKEKAQTQGTDERRRKIKTFSRQVLKYMSGCSQKHVNEFWSRFQMFSWGWQPLFSLNLEARLSNLNTSRQRRQPYAAYLLIHADYVRRGMFLHALIQAVPHHDHFQYVVRDPVLVLLLRKVGPVAVRWRHPAPSECRHHRRWSLTRNVSMWGGGVGRRRKR